MKVLMVSRRREWWRGRKTKVAKGREERTGRDEIEPSDPQVCCFRAERV